MSDWSAPPTFSPDGTLPPVRSPMNVLPNVYVGRSGPKLGRSAVKMLASGNYENHPNFGEVLAWLADNCNDPAYLGADFESQTKSANRVAVGGLLLTVVPGGFLIGAGLQVGATCRLYLDSRREILRIEGRSFWERNDPVSYVAPGLTSTLSVSYTAGLSSTRSREFAATIGASFSRKRPGNTEGSSKARDLSAQFAGKWMKSITRSEEVERRWTNQVHNPWPDKTRVVAIWTPMINLSIARLVIANNILAWQKLDEFEYCTDTDMATTSADIVL